MGMFCTGMCLGNPNNCKMEVVYAENVNERLINCAKDPCHHAIDCKDFVSIMQMLGFSLTISFSNINIQIHSQPGGYFCNCEMGWMGIKCDINIDDCEQIPCFNGAICIDLINSFNCFCAHGFTGIHLLIMCFSCKLHFLTYE